VALRLLLAAVFLPGLAAAAAATAARFLPESARLRRAAAALALVLGYVTAHLAAVGAPSFPPVDTTQGLFYLALVCGVLGVVMVDAPAWPRALATLAIVGSMLGLTLHPLIRHQWSAGTTLAALLGLGAGALALWWSYAALAARLQIAVVRAAWIAVFAAAGMLLVFARTALLGQLATSVAVALLAVTIAAPASAATAIASAGSATPERPHPAGSGLAAGLAFLAPMLHALVLNGVLYAELGLPAAVALALAPLAAASALALGRRRPVARLIAAALVVAILLTPFVVSAAIEYVADDGGYSDYEE
jgi:hypothetical protein